MLITAAGSVLLLVDMQQRLLPAIHDGDAVLANAVRLATAAGLLDVPVCATEQNPAGLGPSDVVGNLTATGRMSDQHDGPLDGCQQRVDIVGVAFHAA